MTPTTGLPTSSAAEQCVAEQCAAFSPVKAHSAIQRRSRQERMSMRSDDAASPRALTALEEEAKALQEALLALVDAPIENLLGDALNPATQDWLQQRVKPAAAKKREDCESCSIPSVQDLFDSRWPSNEPVLELCTCGDESATGIVAHVATGLSRPWSCADRCFGLAPRVKPEKPLSLIGKSTGIKEQDPIMAREGWLVDHFYFTQGCSLTDLSSMTPSFTNVVLDINWWNEGGMPDLRRTDHFALRYRGFLTIHSAGQYTFFTTSDDGSKLWVDNQDVLNNDGCHPMEERSGSIYLAAGRVPMQVEFFENGGGAGLVLQYQGPDTDNAKRVIPESVVRTLDEDLAPITSTTMAEPSLLHGWFVDHFYFTQGCSLTDLSSMTPSFTNVVLDINWWNEGGMPDLRRTDHFALRYRGFLTIHSAGQYTFFTTSDDGSKLWVDNQDVLNNDGCHPMEERSGSIYLAAGRVPMQVEFFENGGGAGLELQYQGPDTDNAKRVIPESVVRTLDEDFPDEDAEEEATTTADTQAVEQQSTTTTTAGETYGYMGCYKDDSSRSFSGEHTSVGVSANTVKDCFRRCKDQGYVYMAIQSGDQCFCGDTYKTGGNYGKVADTECSRNGATCPVANGCGEAWRNSIYKIDTEAPDLQPEASPSTPAASTPAPPQPATSTYGYIGCFKDDSSRAFGGGHKSVGSGAETVKLCFQLCTGYTYMAIQSGDQCFCGMTFKRDGNYGQVADAECSRSCHVANGCGEAWRNSVYKIDGTALSTNMDLVVDSDDNLGPLAQAAPAAECSGESFVGSKSITLPDHCWGYVMGNGSDGWKELPPGTHTEADLISRGVFNESKCGDNCTILAVRTVSNRPPDCAEEVLLRLLMVEYLEPGVDDSLMTPEEKFLFGDVSRYGHIAKFRAAKTAPTMVRFLFHDAGDFDNTETMSGSEVSIGRTGTDGCLHTFRGHRGKEGSWRGKGEGNPWEENVQDEFDEGTNLGHNKNLVTDVFEAFLRLHSVNDLGSTEGGIPLKVRAPHFWDTLDKSALPRLTRPDAVTLGANAAMEAMFGFGEPLEMKYGRWYGQECAGRRDDALFPNVNRRRRFRTNDARGIDGLKKLFDTGDRVRGIEPFGIYQTVIKTPFALHDEHKKSWCPVASTLPAVKNKMGLSDAESVALFGAHSIARVERPSKVPCSYMSNMFFCPQMCPKVSEGKGVRYNNGFVFDDSPELMDNRYFANMMDSDFQALPHCVALGASGKDGPGVPNPSAELDQGIVRFGVMGLGCQPSPWAPVVDANLTRPCVAGYKTDWQDQSQCEIDTCIDRCIAASECTHVWDDPSEECRRCKFGCDDFFAKHLPVDIWWFNRERNWKTPYDADRKNLGMEERFKERPVVGSDRRAPSGSDDWAPTLRHYSGGKPMAQVEELRQFRWCKYTDSYEGHPLLGQGKDHAAVGVPYVKSWLMWAPGPVDPLYREWGGPGTVMNMEQFAFLHSNPTPIFMMAVDWSLLGQESSKKWVNAFGRDNQLFERTFASAWKKVTSAGWDAAEMPKSGWSGSKLEKCKESSCTAKDGKFWCPVDMVNDRLKYLPKPASLRLVLGECTGGDPPDSKKTGDCKLVGGFGVRGSVQCGSKTYHCCSERACEWEKWLVQHRQADMSEEATCPFTPEEKQAEVNRTVDAWRGGADRNGAACTGGEKTSACGATKPSDLGYDYRALQTENLQRLFAHKDQATEWFNSHRANGTLPSYMICGGSSQGGHQECYRYHNGNALEFLSIPTGEKDRFGVVTEGLIHQEMIYRHWENAPNIYKPF
eukprot:TRINITY_DN9711_c0_g1_i7.p1 TRINITY_DN9711_c0_g1~~TRINITY_DN9711_c0_g1_i7.p1  ORF type:complete len:1818 (+),score=284.41 TRINITY_DN9711_c0_g1_i7:92-5455(+)